MSDPFSVWPVEVRDEKRREYHAYMKSPKWRNLRRDVIRMRGTRCEGCGVPSHEKFLHCHHLTYERFGHESAKDLKVLCHSCHETEDRRRRSLRDIKGRRDRWRRGVETFARKKYGEDWEWDPALSWDIVAEEFDEWRGGR